jgi:hypothetical protein
MESRFLRKAWSQLLFTFINMIWPSSSYWVTWLGKWIDAKLKLYDGWKLMKNGEEMKKWNLTYSSIVQFKKSKAIQLPLWFACGSIVTWSLKRRWSEFLFSLKNLVRPKFSPFSIFTKEVDRWKIEVLQWMKSYGTSNLWLQHFN